MRRHPIPDRPPQVTNTPEPGVAARTCENCPGEVAPGTLRRIVMVRPDGSETNGDDWLGAGHVGTRCCGYYRATILARLCPCCGDYETGTSTGFAQDTSEECEVCRGTGDWTKGEYKFRAHRVEDE